MMGSLRAMFADPVRRNRKSEVMPPTTTPTDAATTGNQFRLTGTDWHFNLDTKKTPNLSARQP